MSPTPAPRRRSARARRPPSRLADSATAPPPARRRSTRARRRRPLPLPLPRPADAVFPDEIWEEILLRLGTATDLARASAACASFRRIVSEHQFLRRFRSLHSPPVLGFLSRAGYENRGFLPVGPPHSSATEASALVQAADFTFSFVPDHSAWRFCHASDGRVLLSRRLSSRRRSAGIALEDFVVCDPLHRRYVKTPCIPDDLLAASTPNAWHLLPVLAPAGENDVEESFRVFCPVYHRGNGEIMAFVFSSCNQSWQGISSTIHLPNEFIQYIPYYAHGCFYWMFCGNGYYSLMLDTSEMKFSTIDLPPHKFNSPHAIVEADEGRLWFLSIAGDTIDLYCNNWQTNGVGAQEWLHNKLIPLPKESGVKYRWEIHGTAGCYLALIAHHVICDELPPISEHFVLDIKTLVVEKLCTLNNDPIYGFPYARFPPPLALPSI